MNSPLPNATRQPPARFTIAVGSGKGGVGKSTVSLNLALALAGAGAAVGLLDADLYGPNIPLMLGLTRQEWTGDWTLARRQGEGAPRLLEPLERYGIKVMSAGFILAEDQPLLLEARTVRMLLAQLTWQVAWGELDYLVVDLPPGTADIQQGLLQELPFAGAVLVVTPQDVAHLDAKKAVQQYQRAKVPLLGAVENMSGLLCPHCGELIEVFAPVSEARSLWALGVERLGAVPLDPAMSRSGDRGRPILVAEPHSPQADAFRQLAARIAAKLNTALA